MRLQLLGTNSKSGGSPTLYATDRNSYIVQGWKVPGRDDHIEIPHPLLAHLAPGTCLGALLHDTGHGTFTLTGSLVTDPEALSQMRVPHHEASVEVPVAQEIRPDATHLR